MTTVTTEDAGHQAPPAAANGRGVDLADGAVMSCRTADKLGELASRRAETERPEAAAVHHGRGKRTPRERVGLLLDPGSFVELDDLARHRCANFGAEFNRPYGDGVITGYGTVDGRRVCVYAQDASVLGGSVGEVFGIKVGKLLDLALKVGCPVIGINDSGGARLQEGVTALAGYGEVARRTVAASGVVPQISLIMGICVGGAVYTPAATDFTVMVDGMSLMFITGPEVIKHATGEVVSPERLGGGRVHAVRSGNAHYLATDEKDAAGFVRSLLSYLPANNAEEPPAYNEAASLEISGRDRELDRLIPAATAQVYDMREVIEHVVDAGSLLEIHALFAPNLICGFARIEGKSLGVVANQPLQRAGALDIDAAEKGARFVRTCDAFNIPLLTFADVPGFLPSADQEWNGIIRRGAKLGFAYMEATVPKITVITRKAYGGGYAVMGSKELGADLNFAWPTAQIGIMGAGPAADILSRRLASADANGAEVKDQIARAYEASLLSPYAAAERGLIDKMIMPSETRMMVTTALRVLRAKSVAVLPRKHTNIPL